MRNLMWLVPLVVALFLGCEDRVIYEDDFCMETSGWDDDGDGIFNECDTCPLVPDPSNIDSDKDGWGDVCDPCPYDRFDRCQGPPVDGDGDVDSDGDGDSDGDSDSDGDTDGDSDSDGDADLGGNCEEECDDACMEAGYAGGICSETGWCQCIPFADGDGDADSDGDSDGDVCISTESQCLVWDELAGFPWDDDSHSEGGWLGFTLREGCDCPSGRGEDVGLLFSDGCWDFAAASDCEVWEAGLGPTGIEGYAAQSRFGGREFRGCYEICWTSLSPSL